MPRRESGLTVIEMLVGLAVFTTVSAAMLPAIALAARLQRDSGIEMEAAIVASRRLETVKIALEDGPVASGSAFVDRTGDAAPEDRAVFECRWLVETAPGAPGVSRIAVQVSARGGSVAVTLSTVVPDG
jgi:hypothetical protein